MRQSFFIVYGILHLFLPTAAAEMVVLLSVIKDVPDETGETVIARGQLLPGTRQPSGFEVNWLGDMVKIPADSAIEAGNGAIDYWTKRSLREETPGRRDAAIRLLRAHFLKDQDTPVNSDDALQHTAIGIEYLAAEHLEAAIRTFQSHPIPEDPIVKLNLGVARYRQAMKTNSSFKPAIEAFEQAKTIIGDSKSWPVLLTNLASARRAQAHVDTSLDDQTITPIAESLAEIKATYGPARMLLGNLQLDQDRFDAALSEYDEAIALGYDHAKINKLWAMAIIPKLLDSGTNAIKELRQHVRRWEHESQAEKKYYVKRALFAAKLRFEPGFEFTSLEISGHDSVPNWVKNETETRLGDLKAFLESL